MSESKDQLHQVDYDTAWKLCGQSGDAPAEFRDSVDYCLRRYKWKRAAMRQKTARECSRHFAKLSKKASDLLAILDESEEQFAPYLYEGYDTEFGKTENGDQDFFDLMIGTENEGLHYFEVQFAQLRTLLGELERAADDAPRYHHGTLGRPAINRDLEAAIQQLSEVYTALTGAAAKQRLTFDATGHDKPYKGPFIDFVTTVLWSHAGKEIPTNSVIGEATRKALGLRK